VYLVVMVEEVEIQDHKTAPEEEVVVDQVCSYLIV
tara:strand:- start:277 stop:381 length:105 start_codon:yes stop_codon:yes gene_type:complete